ncbi:MAG TPA: hypothetical protein VJL35_03380 [Gemmatimonadaceae bacterium]|nr:hypothetical protein [Gemmatimonadaceae bacterium]
MRNFRLCLLFGIAVLASGCNVLSGRCLYELRNAQAFGSVSLGGTDSLTANVVETEQRDYQPDKDMSWQILAPALKGHVQKIVLLENGTSTTPSYEFSIAPETASALSSGFVSQSGGADINGFYDLLTSGTAVIRVTTDIPGKTQIDLVLQHVQKTDWNRPYCS